MTQANPIEIVFRHMPRAELVEEEVRAQIDHLHQFCDRIHGCEVAIEPEERHHRQPGRIRVHVRLHLSGRELLAGHHPARPGHEDPLLAVRDTFKALARQLQDHEGQRRHREKTHFDPASHGRVARLEYDHGFVEAFDGREIYFHRNSLLNADFDALAVGLEVRFHEEPGDAGPQASSVTVTGSGPS